MNFCGPVRRLLAVGGVVVLAVILSVGVQRAAGQAVIEQSGNFSISPERIVRAIDDPQLGDRWLLTRDEAQPGGPGRLIRVTEEMASMAAIPLTRTAKIPAPAAVVLPVIHAGDRLVVEERTAVADVHLEAVALGLAKPGARFAARLKIGGRVVPAIALGPGRAVFAPPTLQDERPGR